MKLREIMDVIGIGQDIDIIAIDRHAQPVAALYGGVCMRAEAPYDETARRYGDAEVASINVDGGGVLLIRVRGVEIKQ